MTRFQHNSRGILHEKSFTFQQLSRVAAAELSEISAIYMKLTRLVSRLNSDYQHFVCAALMSYLFTNVTYGYNLFLIVDGSANAGASHFTPALGGSCLCLLFTDLCLFYWVCNATQQSAQRISRQFREFSGFLVDRQMDEEFERHVSGKK